MTFSSRHNSKSMVNVGNSLIASISRVRDIDVMFDSTMATEQQVNAICRLGYDQLRKSGCIRRYLSNEATKSLMNRLVTSRLSYCNVPLHCIHNNLIDKVQRVQNTAACYTMRTSHRNHITPVLMELYWLPICYWIQYNILVQKYDSLNDHSPLYIDNMLFVYRHSRTFISQNSFTLITSRIRTTCGKRCINHAPPSL